MRNMKQTREQISLASLCVNPSKQPTIPLIPHNPHYFTNTNTPKKPASLPKGRWRNSSIICPTSLWQAHNIPNVRKKNPKHCSQNHNAKEVEVFRRFSTEYSRKAQPSMATSLQTCSTF